MFAKTRKLTLYTVNNTIVTNNESLSIPVEGGGKGR